MSNFFDDVMIRANRSHYGSNVEILIHTDDSVCKQITVEREEPGEIVQPSIKIPNNAAQTLMDDLWHAGFRPTEGSGSAGALKAIENHLSDMRKIAFKKLGFGDK